jgi:DNA polymerase I-like protein with 3'-5' exonuclease and polymerase domains
MIVGLFSFDKVLEALSHFDPTNLKTHYRSVDTETTSLRPYHGGRLFSIIIANGANPETDSFYFNFQYYPGLTPEYILRDEHLEKLKQVFENPNFTWFAHNAKFDMAMLANENIFIKGPVHCTQANGRIEFNDHLKYDLATSLERIGLSKDEAVENYITDKGLWEWVTIPGKKARKKNKFYWKVPFDIIAPYGEKDAAGTWALGVCQLKSIEKQDSELPPGTPKLVNIMQNERRLTKTVFDIERVGIKIDRKYCERAAAYELDRAEKAMLGFHKETGRSFSASSKLFEEIFASEKDLWEYTEKGNPSFESGALAKFKNPAAKYILDFRDAKSKSDFYFGFLYHADQDDVIHPGLNPDRTIHGRFSSSDPNLQNLTNEEDVDSAQEFLVRRAFIPRPGYVFVMPDWDQMEYKMMLDYACNHIGELTPLAKKVLEGWDVHKATAHIAEENGNPITRKEAKISNFLTIYGGGDGALASQLGCTISQARAIRAAIRQAAPEIDSLISAIIRVAEQRGFLFNWAGRRYTFSNRRFCYKAPNYLISGGCADVMKFVMNEVHEELALKKSRIVLTIHDELPIEVHESELATVPRFVAQAMETRYPHKYLPLTCAMEYSAKSLADKVKGFPV